MNGLHHFLANQTATLLNAYIVYRPLRVLTALSALTILSGLTLGIKYLYFALSWQGGSQVQPVILAAVLWIPGFQVFLIGLVADLIGFNRKINGGCAVPCSGIRDGRTKDEERAISG